MENKTIRRVTRFAFSTILVTIMLISPRIVIAASDSTSSTTSFHPLARTVGSTDNWEWTHSSPINNSSAWSLMNSGADSWLLDIWGTSDSDVFVVGLGGTILHYAVSTWIPMNSGTTMHLNGIWGSSNSNIYAVGGAGGQGIILHYDGSTWSPSLVTGIELRDIWGSSPSDIYAVGALGTLLHYDGNTWIEVNTGISHAEGTALLSIWGSSASNVYAVGAKDLGWNGLILHYDGNNWVQMSTGTSGYLLSVWGSSATDVFAVGYAGNILHLIGNSWSPMNSGVTVDLSCVWGTSGSDVYAGGAHGIIVHYDGNVWSQMDTGIWIGINGIWGGSATDIFAVGNAGTILHYRIYGIPVDFRFNINLGKGLNNPVDDVWCLQIMLNSDPDTCITTSGDGSPGNETTSFGDLTENAVKRFQEKYADEILEPAGLPQGTGYVGELTRMKLNEILSSKLTQAYKAKFGLLNSGERKVTIWQDIKAFKNDFSLEDFPNELILAIAAAETGEGAHWNNEHVANDWGRGIMQITSVEYVGAGGVNSDSEDCIAARNQYSKVSSSRYYTNTPIGIEANVKDGLYALADKYDYSRTFEYSSRPIPYGDSTITITGEDFEKIVAIWGYNGIVYEHSYLADVADSLENLKEYFDVSMSEEDIARWVAKLNWANDNRGFITATMHSSAELRVYDATGNITGLINGEIKEEVLNSHYDSDNEMVIILFPPSSYSYEVVGTSSGIYRLEIHCASLENDVTFAVEDIPTSLGATHQYSVDWNTLSQGYPGVTIQVDSNGDGTFERTITSDDILTHDEFILQTSTVVDFKPDTLNLKSKGEVVTTYVELPKDYDVAKIDISSVKLNGEVLAMTKPTTIGDYDKDGVPDLMVKFDRGQVQKIINEGGKVRITITGTVNGTMFEGVDYIRVIE